MAFTFVPKSFVMSEELKEWTRDLGFSEAQLKWQEEKWRCHQYTPQKKDPVRCWKTWAMNCVEWGKVEPPVQYVKRGPVELTDEQRKADAAKAWAELNRLKGVK